MKTFISSYTPSRIAFTSESGAGFLAREKYLAVNGERAGVGWFAGGRWKVRLGGGATGPGHSTFYEWAKCC